MHSADTKILENGKKRLHIDQNLTMKCGSYWRIFIFYSEKSNIDGILQKLKT